MFLVLPCLILASVLLPSLLTRGFSHHPFSLPPPSFSVLVLFPLLLVFSFFFLLGFPTLSFFLSFSLAFPWYLCSSPVLPSFFLALFAFTASCIHSHFLPVFCSPSFIPSVSFLFSVLPPSFFSCFSPSASFVSSHHFPLRFFSPPHLSSFILALASLPSSPMRQGVMHGRISLPEEGRQHTVPH